MKHFDVSKNEQIGKEIEQTTLNILNLSNCDIKFNSFKSFENLLKNCYALENFDITINPLISKNIYSSNENFFIIFLINNSPNIS